MNYAASLFISFIIVFFLIPFLRRIALNMGFVDQPSQRKVHAKPIPLLGGLALYIGVIVTLVILFGFSSPVQAAMIGGTMVLIAGLFDDYYKSKGREFPVWPRLLVYLAASAIPVVFGIRIIGISTAIFGGEMMYFSETVMWIATMLWVFGLMNMVNFIDGVDGLAAGIVLISALTMFVAAVLKSQADSAALAMILVGACAGFLLYNFHPARIFMGDAGAVFLGYMLALLSIEGTLKSATLVSLLTAILALGVPILDTLIVFTRRISEQKGLHKADRLHTHHSLMNWGLTQTQTVSFLYLIGSVFALLSIIVVLLFS